MSFKFQSILNQKYKSWCTLKFFLSKITIVNYKQASNDAIYLSNCGNNNTIDRIITFFWIIHFSSISAETQINHRKNSRVHLIQFLKYQYLSFALNKDIDCSEYWKSLHLYRKVRALPLLCPVELNPSTNCHWFSNFVHQFVRIEVWNSSTVHWVSCIVQIKIQTHPVFIQGIESESIG